MLQPAGAAVSKVPVKRGEMPGPVCRAGAGTPCSGSGRAAGGSGLIRSAPVPVALGGHHDGLCAGACRSRGMGGLPAMVGQGRARRDWCSATSRQCHNPCISTGMFFRSAEINGGRRSRGRWRNSLMVEPPKATVKVVFDANDPGIWAFHCHNLLSYGGGHVLDAGVSRVFLKQRSGADFTLQQSSNERSLIRIFVQKIGSCTKITQ